MSVKSVVDSPFLTKIPVMLGPLHTELLQNHIQYNIYHHTKTRFTSSQTWLTDNCLSTNFKSSLITVRSSN